MAHLGPERVLVAERKDRRCEPRQGEDQPDTVVRPPPCDHRTRQREGYRQEDVVEVRRGARRHAFYRRSAGQIQGDVGGVKERAQDERGPRRGGG
jgi:hypothetical protein